MPGLLPRNPICGKAPRLMEKINFYDQSPTRLRQSISGLGKESFRSSQLFQWVYQKQTTDFDQMSNLAKDFREELKRIMEFKLPEVSFQTDSTDGTRKFLMKVDGGKEIESVLIPNGDRTTLCVSSEVGCAMGCKFCFTAKMGLMRRLHTYEIVGQFINARNNMPEGRTLTNIVFMGMGEPLDNFENVSHAIETIHSHMGFKFSKKRVTISTSGIAPLIPAIADLGVRLAVSLNATTNEVRDRVMPINRKYPLQDLMSACKEYYEKSRDAITFEYVLLKGVNDTYQDAVRIVELTRNIPCKINLIPFNEHPDSGFQRPEMNDVHGFQKWLMRLGRHVLIRRTMGRDIYAACGQLRSEMENHPKKLAN